jgi:4-amino-4-deoxy-L-arabinose transferase-like glycosyltransferase
MKKFIIGNALLLTIIILGTFLRIIFINSDPSSMYGDELTMVGDMYSILHTGKDQLGNFMPLTFPMGAGRPGGYIYFSLPFVLLFGPTPLGVRSLSLLSGVGLIIVMFFLGKRLVNKQVGLFAALITAFSPWDISLSRGGFEAHFALFLSVLGIYGLIEATQRRWWYIISALSFALAIHTYPTYKMTLPLFLLVYGYFLFPKHKSLLSLKNNYLFLSIGILVIAIILAIIQTFSAGSESRFTSINIFARDDLKQSILQKINTQRNLSDEALFLKPVFHNKLIEYGLVLEESYIKNLSPEFLFLHGDNNPRHNPGTMGELFLADMILLFIGLGYLWSTKIKTYFNSSHQLLILLSLWVLIAPIPTALLLEQHALRDSFLLPPLILLSAIGLHGIMKFSKNMRILFLILCGAMFIFQFFIWSEKVYFLATNEFSRFWAYPAKQAVEVINQEKSKYDYVILSDRLDNSEFAYQVYNTIDPKVVIQKNSHKDNLLGREFKQYDNVYVGFIPESEVVNTMNTLNGSVLYIGSIYEKISGAQIEQVTGLDNLPAFIVIRKER